MAIVVKTVKPGGGGDFTTLGAWKTAAVADTSNFWWAECYGGGNLGTVVLSGFDAGLVADANNYIRIYAAAGERHTGTFDTNKAKILPGAISTGITVSTPAAALNFLKIDGLQFIANATNSTAAMSLNGLSNIVIDGNLCLGSGSNKFTGGTAVIAIVVSTVNIAGGVIRNNAIWPGTSSTDNGIRVIVSNASATATGILIDNNTISAAARGINLNANASAGACDATIRNNICLGSSTADFILTDTGSHWTATGSYNLSSDATGDDWGATGALINQTAANVVTDVTADLRLKAGSPALDVGTSLSGSFTTDAIGTTRPQGSAWDMGAFETIVLIAYKLFHSPILHSQTIKLA